VTVGSAREGRTTGHDAVVHVVIVVRRGLLAAGHRGDRDAPVPTVDGRGHGVAEAAAAATAATATTAAADVVAVLAGAATTAAPAAAEEATAATAASTTVSTVAGTGAAAAARAAGRTDRGRALDARVAPDPARRTTTTDASDLTTCPRAAGFGAAAAGAAPTGCRAVATGTTGPAQVDHRGGVVDAVGAAGPTAATTAGHHGSVALGVAPLADIGGPAAAAPAERVRVVAARSTAIEPTGRITDVAQATVALPATKTDRTSPSVTVSVDSASAPSPPSVPGENPSPP